MIHVFVPTGVYPPDIGGPATYVPMLEKYLPAKGFSIEVLPFRTVRHLPKGIAHIAYFFESLKMTRRANVVYAQDAISVGVPAYLAALITRTPFVVKIVGDHVWEQGRQRFGVTQELDAFPFWPTHPYLIFLRILQQVVVRSARTIIVPSVYLKNVVLRWGIAEQCVVVVHNGIDMPIPIEEPKEDIKHPLIVSAGRLVSWKGFSSIIEATAPQYDVTKAVKTDPTWNLILIGDGLLRGVLESQVDQYNMRDRVRFIGSLPREQLHGWLKVADAFVLNSTYEGLPHILIEAMLLGTPVVATDIAGNREVIRDDREGLLVKVGDDNWYELWKKIKKALEEGKGSPRVVAAQERARAFSVTETIDGLARVLKQVCPVSRISA